MAVGGYRFLAQDLQEWARRLGQGALLTALPDRLSGHRLAGRALDNARARDALTELGLNPLMVEAFRDRSSAGLRASGRRGVDAALSARKLGSLAPDARLIRVLSMSQQGPILVVSTARRPSFAATLDVGRLFPVVETEWADAVRAVEQVQPAAVLAATSDTDAAGLAALAARVAARQPYLPLIAVDPQVPHPDNVIPFFQTQMPQTQATPAPTVWWPACALRCACGRCMRP